MDVSSDLSKLIFHQKLETPSDCVTKYNKQECLKAIKKQVAYCDLQMFFTVPTTDGTMKNLILNFHILDLDDITKECESCLINPDTVLDDNHCETQE